jgi:serine/threonine-protein kinase RsbW
MAPARPCLLIVTVETTELTLPSRIEAVNEAASVVARILGELGANEQLMFGIDMAIREAVTNAVVHGNKRDDSKQVRVEIKSSQQEIEISVRDQGPGFNPTEVPDPTTAENLMKTSGRGIFFMRNFVDEVEWLTPPGGGTIVKLTKRF